MTSQCFLFAFCLGIPKPVASDTRPAAAPQEEGAQKMSELQDNE